MKRSSHPLALASVIAAVIALVAAGASSATTIGPRLTNDEYVLLGDSQAASKSAGSAAKPNWQKARAACVLLGRSTPLLRSTRASCLASLGELRAWLGASQKAASCSQTTTTGLAAAAADSQLNELVCLNPAYQALNRAVDALTAADRALRESGVERGFSGRCLITLVPTTQQLAAETSYLGATKRLVADLALYIKVRDHKAPRNAISGATLVEAEVAVTPARDHWLSVQQGYSLSVCPHA